MIEGKKSFYLGCLIFLSLLLCVFIANAEDNTKCTDCHSDKDSIKSSIHSDIACTDCHSEFAKITEFPHKTGLKPVDCSICHEDSKAAYDKSLHGEAFAKGIADAPRCHSCHGTHDIKGKDDPNSQVSRINIPNMCGKCHGDLKFVEKQKGVLTVNPYQAYKKSIHGEAVAGGATMAAVCIDCHGNHNMRLPNDPDSLVSRKNTPSTCGKCHLGIYKVFDESIHGKAAKAGVSDAPICTDCHGIHAIKSHIDPKSSVSEAAISLTTCPKCHSGIRLTEEYGIAAQRVTSYLDSFHGLAQRGGSNIVANCASCHGVHDILPSSDPRSTINKNNLPKTCGKCHPGAGQNFARGAIHVIPSLEGEFGTKAVFYVKWFYIVLIVSTIGGMAFHNGLDFLRKLIGSLLGTRKPITKSGVYYERLNLSERIQHVLLLSSFTILVLTGFALKFPDTWWVAPMREIEGGMNLRGLIHRIAALVMVGTALYHIYFLLITKRGRFELKEMLPKVKDVFDTVENLKYLSGISSEKPRFKRFNYIEKSEYWALIWGTFVMVATGFVLWFEVEAMKFFPKWISDVTETIHYYEAWLATLAIIVWHFYYVIFNPDVYPMNWTWLTGKISKEEMEHEHPLELEEIENGESKHE